MPGALTISATFLTGRYHGEEWPPSPARLMQALVAAATSGGQRDQWSAVQESLRWLERLPAPLIRARTGEWLSQYRLAVPNNDLDTAARDWLAGKWNDGSSIRTMKSVRPRLMAVETPHVQYEWTFDETEESLRFARQLTSAVHALYCLGWGVDMAYADVHIGGNTREETGWTKWIPGSEGDIFKAPAAGFLDDLKATFDRYVKRSSGLGVDTSTRPSVYREQAYRKAGTSCPPCATFGLRKPPTDEDPYQDDSFSRPWQDAMEISAWMRHSAGLVLAGKVDERILATQIYGHSENAQDSNTRISYVPLPSIHPVHGDGRIRRVMIVGPRGADNELVHRLRMNWRGVALQTKGNDMCILSAQRDGVTNLYTGLSDKWRTVTPVILHGYNSYRGVISVAKTEKLLLHAFEMAGLSSESIASLAFQAAPFWKGCESATRIRVPKHLQNYPRYHVQVNFKTNIEGPILAGIGRHYGLGVFARNPS